MQQPAYKEVLDPSLTTQALGVSTQSKSKRSFNVQKYKIAEYKQVYFLLSQVRYKLKYIGYQVRYSDRQ
jgi:hypothetical protein